ncbi:MAG TPA: helix-turn-helix domain-containing protein [Thermoanaerobaculia bacterium]|nr:helix-turn-helix domain-containing protein [Thermoanaerobaculia bacterium]
MAKLTYTKIFILLHEDVSVSLALLMRDILERANQVLGRKRFGVQLVGRPGLARIRSGPVTIRVQRAAGRAGYLVVPPLAPGSDPFIDRPGESRLIRRLHEDGTIVFSACLGSLLVAQAGILSGRDATTHWAWIQQASERFPSVRWDARKMLCDSGEIVTSGGFLAAVDLTLALVDRMCPRPVSRELGRLLLADSTRQHQSVYATSLVAARTEDPRMKRLERWLSSHLSAEITVGDMAGVCHLSPRTFHREFVKAYGCTPKKLLQLKRIERVRRLLRQPDLSIEQAIERVGVSDVPSFRKIFQRELGLSPAEYRRRIRAADL